MSSDTTFLLFFSANLTFLVTNLYGWLLKRFYVPLPLKEHFDELYPAHRSVARFYLLQLFEVPYLFMVGQPEALFYVNGTALLVFSSFMVVMVTNYFFPQRPSLPKRLLFLLPVWACWVALLLPIFKKELFTPKYQLVMTCIVMVAFAGYLFLLNRFRRQLMLQIREIEEDEYSNEEDFPVRFAKSINGLPLTLCVMLAITFLLNDASVKIVRDVIFTVIDVGFVIYTLNPHRKLKSLPTELQQKMDEETEATPAKHRLTDIQRKEMEAKMLKLIMAEKLYLEDHFSLNDLVQRMKTNKTYLSEVIACSEYGSFYQLVNTLRIEHACRLLAESPTAKMEQVAFASGFSSGSAFSQVFKRIKGVSPSEYLREKA